MATPRPTPRPRPPASDVNRDSNALRASVLDAALELGIGNKTVANWVFNSVDEADEQEEEETNTIAAPSLTTSPTATSDESYQFISSPPSSEFYGQSQSKNGDFMNGLAYSSYNGLFVDPSSRFVHFGTFSEPFNSTLALNTASAGPKHNKLKKPRPDDYQNDGGYVSDRGSSKKEKKKLKDKDSKLGYESEGDAVVAKKKKKIKTSKDGSKSSLDGEESDGGYLSEAIRGKRSFFRRIKSKHQNAEVSRIVPPLPPPLPVPHPIANRFGASRSATPNTFTSVSDSVRAISFDNTSGSLTPTSREPKHDSTVLTQAFKEDAYSVSGSVDWSHTYTHFPRNGRVPPISPTTFLSSSSHMTTPAMSTSPRPTKIRPNPPLVLSVASDYGRPSQVSPVPSRAASIAPDPDLPETVQHNLLEPSRKLSDTSLKPVQGLSPRPSPINLTQSSDHLVPPPLPSPGGTMRPRTLALYDLPPPSPPPSGPLPQPPLVSDPAASGMKPSKLGPSQSPNSTPNISPSRVRSPPFTVSPATGAEDKLQHHFDRKLRQPLPQSSALDLRNSSTSDRERRRDLRTPDTQSVSDRGHSEVGPSGEVAYSDSPVPAIRNSGSNEDYMPGHLSVNDQHQNDEWRGTRPLIWNRRGAVDGKKNEETQAGSVKNLASLYDKKGHVERAAAHPSLPSLTPKSILRHGLKT